ncbi:MAG: TonB-dependent receptor [Candidatus Eisenbacteria bacterium]|nr:TonB-dependent receptor [Candidatus Eisenbacteria bacterium]
MNPVATGTPHHNFGAHQKALLINLDKQIYGTFAEIGAGQEVARWFFRVGAASDTVAKTISAYDMQVSDAIYGKSERYVGQQRLVTMLDHEYGLLLERLESKRGSTTRFFAFAETVAAQSYVHRDECHGWMGIRFQTVPGREPSQVIIHIRMLDHENLAQQEALGIVGVNLVYGAHFYHDEPDTFIQLLLDDLSPARISVDMIQFSGPAFSKVDNRLMSLQLVRLGLTEAAMFTADGAVVNAADMLYNKSILVERGSFRPVTKVTLDMLHCAEAQFVQEPGVEGDRLLVLMEMTLKNLTDGGEIDHQDFLDRVDILSTLGKPVLISNYAEFHRLAGYLFHFTKKRIGIAMGVSTLREIFDEKYYADLEGGILESFGRLFKNDLKLYIYPARDHATGALITAGNLRVAPNLSHLYSHLHENRHIEGLKDIDERCLSLFSRSALAKIKAGDPSWEEMVPMEVAAIIKERRLLGCRGNDEGATSS